MDDGEAATREIRSESKKIESNFRSESTAEGEQFLQYEAAYFTQVEELNLLRRKCQSLQLALDKSHDEKNDLELQLVAERTRKEREIKNVETIVDKNKLDFNNHLHSVKLDQERWKQQAESTTLEIQFLQQQLKLAQAQKSDAVKQLSKLTEEHTEMDTQRQLIDMYIKKQKESMTDLHKY